MDKEKKKLDVMKSKYLSVLIRELNSIGIQKEDLVCIYPPFKGNDEYTAVFFC